jgi:hypothetical protein
MKAKADKNIINPCPTSPNITAKMNGKVIIVHGAGLISR